MHFSFCNPKHRALNKGEHIEKQGPQKQPEQARVALNFTPTPQGQVETERLLSGDANAVDDLRSLLVRAERRSRQVPRLNLNVRATERFLQGSPEAFEDLLGEQQMAQMRVKKASGRQWLGFGLMGNASLVGESFEHSFRDRCGDSLSSSTRVKGEGECRGHWQLNYCSVGEGCNAQHSRPLSPQGRPVNAGDVDRQTRQPVPSEADEEPEEEFPFDDYFADEEDYQQALCEVTAFAATPARAQTIFIPARTPSLTRKRGQSFLRESSSAGSSEVALLERWSTQVRTGSRDSLLENQGEEAPGGDDVLHGLGARPSVRVSMIAGPLSGPPVVPLPPSPPIPGPLRHSWPLLPPVKDTAHTSYR